MTKATKILILAALIGLITLPIKTIAQQEPLPPIPEEPLPIPEELSMLEEPSEPSMPGRTEGTDTFFEITDSEYLDITLESSEEITVVLESVPKTISLNIEALTSTNSTTLTIGGLEPSKTYYKFENSYKNETVFVSDENGGYSWIQDLFQPHHIWFQPEDNGTVFLPEDCSDYGTWDESAKTCTLIQDLTESVEITTNNIALDCDGYSIAGAGAGYGIYLNNRSNVSIKTCHISNFAFGIRLTSSSQNIVTDNAILNNRYGIYLTYSNSNTFTGNTVKWDYRGIMNAYSNSNIFTGNTIDSNDYYGFFLWSSSQNIVTDNTVSNNQYYGVYLYHAKNNEIYHNNFIDNNTQAYVYAGLNNLFDNGYPSGGNYWSDYVEKYPNAQEINGSGIWDTPYTFTGGEDNYPWTIQDGWKVEIFDVAVILAEPYNEPHKNTSITTSICHLPELQNKTYLKGHNKDYYQDLAKCVNDYYKENSYRTIRLNFEIFDKQGQWYQIIDTNKDEAYYGRGPKWSGIGEIEFINDVISLLDPQVLEKTEKMDTRIIVHSGGSRQKEDGIIENLYSPGQKYALVSETELTGPWAHELGHAILGAPDIYKMGHSGLESSVGPWDLMASGDRNDGGANPPHMSSFTKAMEKPGLDWLDYEDILPPDYGESWTDWIDALSTKKLHDKVYRYLLKDDASEYYILEVRNKSPERSYWDRGVPETAAVIYLVEEGGEVVNIPPEVFLEEFGPPGWWGFNDAVLSPPSEDKIESFWDFIYMLKIAPVEEISTPETYKLRLKIDRLLPTVFDRAYHVLIKKPRRWITKRVWPLLGFGAPIYPVSLPDLDLHVYTDDGRHIGVNYETGEYEVQIPNVFASGDLGNGTEYILIPEEIGNYHFVVSSEDNQKFFEEFPEIAEEIEDKTDGYEVYARYIDPEIGIFESSTVAQDIEPGIELEHVVSGTTDVTVSEGEIFDDIAPITSISLEGVIGQNEWFTSHVVITLEAEDNLGGSGVDRTEYKINSAPIALQSMYTIAMTNQMDTGRTFTLVPAVNFIAKPALANTYPDGPSIGLVKARVVDIKDITLDTYGYADIEKYLSRDGVKPPPPTLPLRGHKDLKEVKIEVLSSKDKFRGLDLESGEIVPVLMNKDQIKLLGLYGGLVTWLNISRWGGQMEDSQGRLYGPFGWYLAKPTWFMVFFQLIKVIALIALIIILIKFLRRKIRKTKPKILILLGTIFVIFSIGYPLRAATEWQIFVQPFTISDEGVHTLYYRSIDNAGNIEETKSQEIKIDKTPPEVAVPVFAESYIYKQPLVIEFSVFDAVSGIFSILTTLNNQPIISGQQVILDQLGINVFTVTATDYAGHTISETKEFKVFYDFSGFLPPLAKKTQYNLGQTIPVKFQLQDYQENYISDIQPQIYIAEVVNGVPQQEQPAVSSGKANVDNIARYDSDKDQYIFNLSTKDLFPDQYQIRADLGDESTQTIIINLEKGRSKK